MQSDPFSTPVGARVLAAFMHDTYRWRTMGGIAREAHLPSAQVAEFIKTYRHCFVQSNVKPGGRALYGITPELRQRALEKAPQHSLGRAAG